MILHLIHADADRGVSMQSIHAYTRTSRQWLSGRVAAQSREADLAGAIRVLVEAHREHKDRRAGSRNLYHALNIREQFGMGVSKFEQLMSRYGLSLSPLRTRVVTTKSDKQSWNYGDKANGLIVSHINQLIVGDLTYIPLGKKMYYLFCLTDVYSARIVGYHLHDRMRAEEALKALEMCVKLRGKANLVGSLHHTDGGAQYFSVVYLAALADCQMVVSRAKTCLQNGYAEQRNGLVKNHLIPTLGQVAPESLAKEIERMFHFYNHERKQEALGWRSPVEYEAFIAEPGNGKPMKLYDYPLA